MLTIRTLDDGLPLVEAVGTFDDAARDDLAKALVVLDAEPAIIVSLERCSRIDERMLRGILEASKGQDGYVIFIVGPTAGLANLAALTADLPTHHIVRDLHGATAFGRAVREVNSVEFSRDGIASPQTRGPSAK